MSLLSFLFSRNHSISLEASLSCFNSTLSACSRCSEWQQALQVAWWFMGLIRGWWCDYVWLVVAPRLVNLMAYRSIHDSVSLSRKYIIRRGKRIDSTKSAIIFVTKLWSSQKEGSSCWKFIPLEDLYLRFGIKERFMTWFLLAYWFDPWQIFWMQPAFLTAQYC